MQPAIYFCPFFYHFCILQPQLNKCDVYTLIFSVGVTHTLCRLHGISEKNGHYSCDVDPLIYSLIFVFCQRRKASETMRSCVFFCHSFVTGLRAHAYIIKLIVTKTYALAHCLSPRGRRASAAPSLVQCRMPFVSLAVTSVTIGHVWVQRRIRWKMQIPVCLLDPASTLAHLLRHL